MKNKILAVFFLLIIIAGAAGYFIGGGTATAFNVQLNGLAQRLMGRRVVNDADGVYNVVKLDNGWLTFVAPERDMPGAAENMLALRDHLAADGIPMLYVQAPVKVNKYDPQLPVGVTDYNNTNIDRLIALLADSGVDCLDLRERLNAYTSDYYSAFFKTDHHWKPETALWAFGEVGRYLNANYGFDIDEALFDPGNYSYETQKNWFLGSQGKRVGNLYGGTDDFTLITPKFPTDFTSEIPHKGLTVSGAFEDVFIFHEILDSRDYFNINTYAAYTGGDYPLQTIINNSGGEKNILLIRVSSSCAFSPFLALGVGRLDAIDPRYYGGSIADYADQVQPDIVIFLDYSMPAA
jgi:hypothetical protein